MTRSTNFKDDPYSTLRNRVSIASNHTFSVLDRRLNYLLQLRGIIKGSTHARLTFNYPRCITRRQDLPFYYEEEFKAQRILLDLFLRGGEIQF